MTIYSFSNTKISQKPIDTNFAFLHILPNQMELSSAPNKIWLQCWKNQRSFSVEL